MIEVLQNDALFQSIGGLLTFLAVVFTWINSQRAKKGARRVEQIVTEVSETANGRTSALISYTAELRELLAKNGIAAPPMPEDV